jgi:phosphoribosylanthranilate isomerase
MTRVRVKICGITNEADGKQAALFGADAIGLNFWSGSRRKIDVQTAEFILRELPPLVEPVALFVNVRFQKVFEVLNQLGRVRTFQWYGDNRELSDTYPFRHIAAFSVSDAQSLTVITHYLTTCRGLGQMPQALLLDAHVPGQYGGTGKQAPWHLLADFQPGVPVILAGGLTPDNVVEAIHLVRPYGVDVASGVEQSPGVKDLEKMRRFIDRVRDAS